MYEPMVLNLKCSSWVSYVCFLDERSSRGQWMRNLETFAWVRPDPYMIFITQYPLFFLNFYCRLCDLKSAFVWFLPLHFVVFASYSPSLWPLQQLLLNLTHCFRQHWQYMAQSQLSLKSYDVSSVKKQFSLIQCLYMTMRESQCDDGSLPILQGPPSFLQMQSIEEVTRGRTLLRGSYYFSITIETNTLAFSWIRPGVHWHRLSHYSTSWQNPKWISTLWIIPICTQFTYKMSCQPKPMTACLHAWHQKNVGLLFATLFIMMMKTRWHSSEVKQ